MEFFIVYAITCIKLRSDGAFSKLKCKAGLLACLRQRWSVRLSGRHYPFYQLSDTLFLQHVVYHPDMTKDPELIIIQFLVDETFSFLRELIRKVNINARN